VKYLYIILKLFFLVLFAGAVSCKKIEYKPTGAGDALIITLVSESDTLFGLGLHAYTYDHFSSVVAYYSDDVSRKFALEPFEGYDNDLSYETPVAEMSQNIPPVGEYFFEATFPGDEFLTFTDVLSSKYVLPPVIETCEYSYELDKVIVNWGEITGDEVLSIKLYNLQRGLLFISQAIDKSLMTYMFGSQTEGWVSDVFPVSGEDYIVEISTYIFEQDSSGSLNIQSVGRIEKTITWGD